MLLNQVLLGVEGGGGGQVLQGLRRLERGSKSLRSLTLKDFIFDPGGGNEPVKFIDSVW